MTHRHLIDDYGHTTQTVPLTALEEAVRYAEAEVRERIASEIERMPLPIMRGPYQSAEATQSQAARIARGSA